jgi:hypothetical protein
MMSLQWMLEVKQMELEGEEDKSFNRNRSMETFSGSSTLDGYATPMATPEAEGMNHRASLDIFTLPSAARHAAQHGGELKTTSRTPAPEKWRRLQRKPAATRPV